MEGQTPAANGYALPGVVVVLILLGMLSAGAAFGSRSEHLQGRAHREAVKAFYAAEAGLTLAARDWADGTFDSLVSEPGDSTVSNWTTLENGCTYRTVVRRVDGGDTSTKLFAITAQGRGPSGTAAARAVGAVFIRTEGSAFPGNAVTVGGRLEISGNLTITGTCGSVHANGSPLQVSGEEVMTGSLSGSGSVTVSGHVEDLDGGTVEPETYAPEQTIPDLDPTDFCSEADYIFENGTATRTSDGATKNLSSGNWGWKYSSGAYETDGDDAVGGVICADNDVLVGHSLGSGSSPFALSIFTTKSVSIPGTPTITAAHSSGAMIVAGGDVKLNGNPSAGDFSFQGVVYAGSQCELSGNPVIIGQLMCQDNPNPSGSENWVSENKLNGNAQIHFDCDSSSSSSAADGMLPTRGWWQIL